MRRRGKYREIEAFGLSFMDCVCCGFGAIILLFVLTKFSKLKYVRSTSSAAVVLNQGDSNIVLREKQLRELRRERRRLDTTLTERRAALTAVITESGERQTQLNTLQQQLRKSEISGTVQQRIGDQLFTARQQLTEEMKRLVNSLPKPKNNVVGGIPVDSEYIVFIVDTSGSMRRHWPLVRRKIEETLEIYPQIKGIQIMNDMGQYMFSQYRGKWIPDTPGRRKVILELFDSWAPFSNSSPVEGIKTAIRKFYSEDHDISLYVFGDDFQGLGMESVIATVDQLNRKDAKGGRRVRIHGVGFPGAQLSATGQRFSTLMRVLCDRNAGTFVGLVP